MIPRANNYFCPFFSDPVFDKRCKTINDTDDHGDTGIEGFWLQVNVLQKLIFFSENSLICYSSF